MEVAGRSWGAMKVQEVRRWRRFDKHRPSEHVGLVLVS